MKAYIVEDDEDMRLILRMLLRRKFRDFTEIKTSEDAETALIEIPKFNPDLVLVDISLPGMNGIELIRTLKPQCNFLCILVVTGHEIDIYKESAIEAGANDIISKTQGEELISSIKNLIKQRDRGGCN